MRMPEPGCTGTAPLGRPALCALATVLSEYDSPQILAGLASLAPSAEGPRSAGRFEVVRSLRPDGTVPHQIFAMPDGRIFFQSAPDGQPAAPAFIDTQTGAIESWRLPFRPFSYFRDAQRNWLWAVEDQAARLHAYDPAGREQAVLDLPRRNGGSPVLPRHGACAGDAIYLSHYRGSHAVMRLSIGDPSAPPAQLLDRLPHVQRLYWADGLLLSLHFSPNSMMVHRVREDGCVLLRVVPLRGEPYSLARLGHGTLIATAIELLWLDADLRPQWSVDIAALDGLRLAAPSVTEAGDGFAWLKGQDADTLYKIAPVPAAGGDREPLAAEARP